MFYCAKCEVWWFQKEAKHMVGYCGCDNTMELIEQGFYYMPEQKVWYQDSETRDESASNQKEFMKRSA